MADQTSTLSIEVRTGNAASELKQLKTELLDVAQAAAQLNAQPAAPNALATKQATDQTKKAVTELDNAMERLSNSSTAWQTRYAKNFGSIATSAKIAKDMTVKELHALDKEMSASALAQAAAYAKQGDAMVKLHEKALDQRSAAERKAASKLAADQLKQGDAAVALFRAHQQKLTTTRLKQAQEGNAALLQAEAEFRRTELAQLRAHITEKLSLEVAAERAMEQQARASQARMVKDRAAAVKSLTVLGSSGLSGSAASSTLFADVLRSEAASSAAFTRQTVAGLTAASGAPSAKDTLFASVLKQEEADAKTLVKGLKNLDTARITNTALLRDNTQAMRDAHGVARGLSGSLGTLWMTYGSLAPLLAGAAIGSVAKNTVGVGKDLEYRLKFLEALGNEPVSTSQMMPAVQGSMKTPLEAAEAMQALGQAGLTSQQSLRALNTVMQLSTLGELGMEQAAVSVTAALAAFNLQTSEAGRVGDVFAKAAAVSNTSVEKITESMKQASTSAAQYHITLEETSAALAVMAQRNITGTMAGTSFRNMTKELYTPIARGAKAMEKLGLSAYDSAGRMRPFQDVLVSLRESLYGLDEQSRNNALEAIFGERGSRAIKPILEDLDNYIDKVKEMEGAQGFLVIANGKLIDTVEGAGNRLQSTIQQTYAKSFDSVKDSVRALLDELDQLAGSEGFTTTVTTIARVFVEGAQAILRNRDALVWMASAYAASKATSIALTAAVATGAKVRATSTKGVTAETLALQANTAAKSQNAAAQTASTVTASTSSALTAVQRVGSTFVTLAGWATRLTSVIGWVSLGYMALSTVYDIVTDKSQKVATQQSSELQRLKSIAEELKKQADQQERLNAERMGGATPTDPRSAQEKFRAESATTVMNAQTLSDITSEQLAKAAEQLASERSKLQALKEQRATGSEITQQTAATNMALVEYNRLLEIANRAAKELTESKHAELSAQESLNRLVASQKLATQLGDRDSAASRLQQQVQALKEDYAVLNASSDAATRKRAQQRISIREKFGFSVGQDYKADAVAIPSGGVDDYVQQSAEKLVKLNEALRSTEVRMSFATPKKGPKDYNDPNYILERANAAAAKIDLQTIGDLEKANTQVIRDQEKAKAKLNEQYLTDDVIAGMRARETAEEKYNGLLDKRQKIINDLQEAMKKATDPKQLKLARDRIAAENLNISGIKAMQGLAGDQAFEEGKQRYLDDNTAQKGVEKLFTKYRNEALKTGDTVANALEAAFGRASTALEDFATTGKLSFRDFTVGVLQDLSKMAMKMAENALFSSIAGWAGSLMVGISSSSNPVMSGSVGTSTSGMNTTFASAFAKGGAFSMGRVVKNAKGNPYTNGVVSQPTLAPMALFGEAGEEAIMPLTRTSDGSLGVKAVPSSYQTGGGNNFNVQTNVYMQPDGSSRTDVSGNSNVLKQMGEEITSLVKGVLNREVRQGGIINKAIRSA